MPKSRPICPAVSIEHWFLAEDRQTDSFVLGGEIRKCANTHTQKQKPNIHTLPISMCG